jgi:signal transduction histidine kinase
MTSSNGGRSVTEIAESTGIPESTLTQAVQAGELPLTTSSSGSAVIEDTPALRDWINDHRPAKIHSSLSNSPEVKDDERLQLLANLPFVARRLVNADYAALTVGNKRGRITEMLVSGLSDKQAESIGHPPVGRGVLGSLDKSDATLRLGDISNHARSTGMPEGHPDMRSMIGVGVSVDDENHRHNEKIRLYVTRISGREPFTAEDQEVIESLATFACQALEIEYLREQETELRIRAEEAEKAKAQFMSMVNHDLKNPIAAMQVAIDIAKHDPDYLNAEFLSDLESSVGNQHNLVESLIDMAKLGVTAKNYEFEDYYAVDLVNEVVRRQQRTPMRCDPVEMGRVLDNLISNGLKYSSNEIRISATMSADLKFVQISVADRGEGIAEEERGRIFEPFERIEDINKQIEGLGLGLAICKTIVDAHSGTIHSIENPDGGTIFRLRLPVSS